MKQRAGFTLLETIIALAVWAILSVSVISVWHHVSNRTSSVLARQSALENARVAMDALLINIQMSNSITLHVRDSDYMLIWLQVPGLNPQGVLNNFFFDFDHNLTPDATRYRRLEFGGNEIARYIAEVIVRPQDRHYIHITVRTGCTPPVVLHGSVDIRGKDLYVRRFTH